MSVDASPSSSALVSGSSLGAAVVCGWVPSPPSPGIPGVAASPVSPDVEASPVAAGVEMGSPVSSAVTLSEPPEPEGGVDGAGVLPSMLTSARRKSPPEQLKLESHPNTNTDPPSAPNANSSRAANEPLDTLSRFDHVPLAMWYANTSLSTLPASFWPPNTTRCPSITTMPCCSRSEGGVPEAVLDLSVHVEDAVSYSHSSAVVSGYT
mmetsp:Transcript_29238/g.69424  ORF Transcript_29238/g.69424 Transcript_29238/m.69424 type:complete len:208 (-) Transcript_29238:692-1315(-)